MKDSATETVCPAHFNEFHLTPLAVDQVEGYVQHRLRLRAVITAYSAAKPLNTWLTSRGCSS